MTDIFLFLKRFLSAPGRIGSIVPSSRFLSRTITREVPWAEARVIVELGPGTGVFTREILRLKRPDTAFLVIERDPQFQQKLQERFPGLLLRSEAVQLKHYLQELDLGSPDVIISGLPFAVFPPDLREAILDQVEEALAPDGLFITFQYSLQLHQELNRRFSSVDVSFTLLNMPPAFVYSCRKSSGILA